jgi:hypothetical protein
MSATVVPEVSGGGRLRGAAALTFALMLVVTAASAFLRLAEPAGVAGAAIDVARGAHRVAASLALVLAIGIAIFGWERFRPLGASRAVATGLVALGVALSFLGRFTPSTHPFVALANSRGGSMARPPRPIGEAAGRSSAGFSRWLRSPRSPRSWCGRRRW